MLRTLGASLLLALALPVAPSQAAGDLKPVSAFSGIADPAQRSVALFEEAGKVIMNPRCVNCHPASDRPLQGDDGHPHQPLALRGVAGIGVPGLYCTACHTRANYDPARVPGNPEWQLAPIEMAWEGKSLGAICRQIKDPARNGARDMAKLVHHMAHNELVGWGWNPGAGREAVPGTQAAFGALFQAWADSGAVCPPER